MATALSSLFTYILHVYATTLGALSQCKVHSSSPVLLTKTRPLRLLKYAARPERHGPPGSFAVCSPHCCLKRPLLYLASLRLRAVLLHISGGTSYQTVRLVFRPYTQLLPSICTSERLTASSCLSSAFTDTEYSSQVYRVATTRLSHLRYASKYSALPTRRVVALLGPCFKTGLSRSAPCAISLFQSIPFSIALLLHYRSRTVFSLRWTLPPIHCAIPNTATPIYPQGVFAILRDYHPLRSAFPDTLYMQPDISRKRDYTRGCSLFARRY